MNKSISEIKEIFKNTSIDNIPDLIQIYKDDKRSGVNKIVTSHLKKYREYLSEIIRVEELNEFENLYYEQGLEFIGGVDEVGRGPLAGPVVACCVILPKNTIIPYIDDSKQLSEKTRNTLYTEIKQKAIDIGIGIVDSKIIDEINILNATYEAMKKAISDLKTKPDILLIDAVRIPGINIVQHPIIQGDSKSISIAASSIIAKVTRDNIMCDYAKEYNCYDFENNKGYGTKKHIEAIKNFGITPIHRRSFLKNL